MSKVQRFIKKLEAKQDILATGAGGGERGAEINNTFRILGHKKMGTGLKVLRNYLMLFPTPSLPWPIRPFSS